MSALGSEFKYGIRIPPIGGIHMEDFEFEVTTYVFSNKSVTFNKNDDVHVKRLDADSYSIIIDSENSLKIGRGAVMAKITCHIPDNDFPDGFRTEIHDNLWTKKTIT